MFGYVKPDLPYLYIKDDTLYKALYCGVCKSIGKELGQISRISLTYDVTFLSALVHNVKGVDVEIKKERCIAHPIISRPMASRDGITSLCASINVILAYFKVKDDIIDEGKGKLKLSALKSAFKKASGKYPEIAKVVETRYEELRIAEKRGESRIDVASDAFALMLKDIGGIALGEDGTENTDELFYFLGKWIYLIDALDDYEKDLKKGCYNPLICAYGKEATRAELLKKNGKEISFVFSDIISSLSEAESKIVWKFNADLIRNIITKGIPKTTMDIMSGKGKKRDKSEAKR